MPNLFISYSRKDQSITNSLVTRLEQNGHIVFIDKKGIDAGEQWRLAIVEAIESADAFIILLSENSLKSDQVRRELDIAVEANVTVLPIDIEPITIPSALKYQLAGLERHDIYTNFEAGVNRLLQLSSLSENNQPITETTNILEDKVHGVFIGKFLICLTITAAAIIIFSISTNNGGLEKAFPTYLMLCGAIYTAFNLTESLLTKEVIREISGWMTIRQDKTGFPFWINSFIKLFDTVFAVNKTVKGIKIPSFLRSSLASFLFAFLLFAVMSFSGFEFIVFEMQILPESWAHDGSWGAVVEALLFTLLLSLFFNVMPDFISLVETRFILQKLQKAKGLRRTINLLLLDLVFTLVIAFIGSAIANVCYPLVAFVMSGFDSRELSSWTIPFSVSELLEVYTTVLNFKELFMFSEQIDWRNPSYYCAVFIYSTFLTSLWIWMYTLSGAIVRVSIKSKALKLIVINTFRVNEKPLSIMGGICISVVSVIFWGVHWISI